ncbi:MAG: GAF domain-containing protein [Fidelibacterota bacterium]
MGIEINQTRIPGSILDKWQNVVNIMAEILDVPSAIITRVDPPEIEVLQSAEKPDNPYKSGDKVKLAKHYCERVVTRNKRMKVNFAPENPDWNNAPEIEYGMVAYLGFPVCWPKGEMFGTICVLDNKKNQFEHRYSKVLHEFRELIESHLSLIVMNNELKTALQEIKTLRGMLPICSYCKKIRDDDGYWNRLETYIHHHSEAEFSHSICPDCAKKQFPNMNIYDELE